MPRLLEQEAEVLNFVLKNTVNLQLLIATILFLKTIIFHKNKLLY